MQPMEPYVSGRKPNQHTLNLELGLDVLAYLRVSMGELDHPDGRPYTVDERAAALRSGRDSAGRLVTRLERTEAACKAADNLIADGEPSERNLRTINRLARRPAALTA